MAISIGKLRGLRRIAGQEGLFTICAMDHRGSLEDKLCVGLTPEVCREDMEGFKEDLCRILSPYASAVLLDPIFGAAQAISHNLPPHGLLVSLEETGYGGGTEARETRLLQGWSVAKIKRMGADAVKLLIYYRHEPAGLARRQRQLVQKVAEDCIEYDLPCVVEALSYPVGEEIDNPALFATRKPKIV